MTTETKIDNTKLAVRYGSVHWEKRSMGESQEGEGMENELPKKFGGIAAVIDRTTDLGWFEEKIARGAFDDALARTDVDIRVLGNHREDNLLGRTKAETAKVFVNADGNLEYEWIPDYENPTHCSFARSIMRGDITQSSFSFYIESDQWEYKDEQRTKSRRTILKVRQIMDVAPVTFPAYEDATAEARSSLQQYETMLQQNTNTHDIDLLKIYKLKTKTP